MSRFMYEVDDRNNVFVISSNFKNIAVFKPKYLRHDTDVDCSVVWYSETGKSLLRVGGNVWQYECKVSNGKFNYKVIRK